MRKLLSTAVVLGLSGLLIGCPAPGKTDSAAKTDSASKTAEAKTADVAKTGDAAKTGETEAPKKMAADLSHVKKGQVYVYEMDASGNKMVMKYVVLDVTDTAVKYETITLVAGTETKGPAAEWAIPAPVEGAATATPAADTKVTNETIEAAGQKWECMVTESSGTKTYTPTKNGLPTWPMFIKQDGASMKSILTKIE
jgi:Tfp pilus assembly protein PilW